MRINDLSDKSKSQIESDLYHEIAMLYKIRYENVVTILGACIEPNFYAIIMEYMPLGSLYDVLHKTNKNIVLSWLDRYSLTWQMSKSINYLHNLNPCIIHRDIKSMNFLMKFSENQQHRFLLKVSDFSLSSYRSEILLDLTANPFCSQYVGTLAWEST